MASELVAEHYNAVPETGLESRTQSRIFYLRNFNNWIKSMLIGEFLKRIRDDARQRQQHGRSHVSVLDMCCGKGGDLLKWKKGNIDELICADIADVSLDQCKSRYEEMRDRTKFERRPQKLFTAEFIHADCSTVRLRERYANPDIRFDLCSCQFSLHYGFGSLRQAKCMLRNACENLKDGGYFVGTIPNANKIVSLVREHGEGVSFKNDVSSISFENSVAEQEERPLGLCGEKYAFNLHEVVNDCPEYLIHFPFLVELMKTFGMELVYKRTFPEVLDEMTATRDGKDLLTRMQGLETFPPEEDTPLAGSSDQYDHVKSKIADLEASEGDDRNRPVKMGTLSKAEWEVANMYMAFAFRKTTQSEEDSPKRRRRVDADTDPIETPDVSSKKAKPEDDHGSHKDA